MAPIGRILCPTDFSDVSAHAVAHASAIAGWSGASIAALHVAAPGLVVPAEFQGVALPDRSAADEAARQRLRAAVADAFREATGAGVEVDVFIDSGSPVPRILEHAARLPADLIVMGTHGTGGFAHLLLGSVTEKVLRRAACPVLTVPPRAQATSRLPFQRVLCAVDFSETSHRALDLAASLARQSQAGLTVLHVLEWPWDEPPPPSFEELPHAQAAMLAEFRRYREAQALGWLEGLEPEAVAVRRRVGHGKAYAEILRVTAEEQADLIVLGVGSRSAVDLAVFGSTASQIVRRAAAPVLTVREGPRG
jgi:nucleotide-binding universal stress UspA family protein